MFVWDWKLEKGRVAMVSGPHFCITLTHFHNHKGPLEFDANCLHSYQGGIKVQEGTICTIRIGTGGGFLVVHAKGSLRQRGSSL